jgi:hypothetical protein
LTITSANLILLPRVALGGFKRTVLWLIECTTSDIQLYLQGYWSCPAAAVANLFEGSRDSRIDLYTQLATSKSLIAISKKPYIAHITLYIRASSGHLLLQQPSCLDCRHESFEDAGWKPPQGTI